MSLENKLDQATGAIKEGFGEVTGDSKTEADWRVVVRRLRQANIARNSTLKNLIRKILLYLIINLAG